MEHSAGRPRLLVYSSLFPHSGQPGAGLFIRERMFRVARDLPLQVVSPRPWSPADRLVRRFRPGYRPPAPRREVQDGIPIHLPRFAAAPGLLRNLDGLSMALWTYPTLRRLAAEFDIIDAHFAYPDGYAATLLGQWLNKPVTITLRGTEVPHSRIPAKRRQIQHALRRATRIFTVSASLGSLAIELGSPPAKVQVVGNGIDIGRFHPLSRVQARADLGLPPDAHVLITVGALVERKGFHRVIATLPDLLLRFPKLHYLIVGGGGGGGEGDWSERLRQQVAELGLQDRVHFLGPLAPAELRRPLSAADLFVLASSNEGWANVILEAMACALPVVATDVGGNREVVSDDSLGLIVPFADQAALGAALGTALERHWDREKILGYAQANTWDGRVQDLVQAFRTIHAQWQQMAAASTLPH